MIGFIFYFFAIFGTQITKILRSDGLGRDFFLELIGEGNRYGSSFTLKPLIAKIMVQIFWKMTTFFDFFRGDQDSPKLFDHNCSEFEISELITEFKFYRLGILFNTVPSKVALLINYGRYFFINFLLYREYKKFYLFQFVFKRLVEELVIHSYFFGWFSFNLIDIVSFEMVQFKYRFAVGL